MELAGRYAPAAPHMIARRSGLIANISDWAGRKYLGSLIYGVSRAAAGRLARDMAHELRPHNAWPPWRSTSFPFRSAWRAPTWG